MKDPFKRVVLGKLGRAEAKRQLRLSKSANERRMLASLLRVLLETSRRTR